MMTRNLHGVGRKFAQFPLLCSGELEDSGTLGARCEANFCARPFRTALAATVAQVCGPFPRLLGL